VKTENGKQMAKALKLLGYEVSTFICEAGENENYDVLIVELRGTRFFFMQSYVKKSQPSHAGMQNLIVNYWRVCPFGLP
jgi:hypothetical protein